MNKNSRSFVSFLCCMFLFFIILAVPSQVSAKTGLSKTELTLSVGQTKTLRLNGVSGKTTYRSSKKSVATVTSKGKITAKGKGSAVITAKNHGLPTPVRSVYTMFPTPTSRLPQKQKKSFSKRSKVVCLMLKRSRRSMIISS